MPKAVGDPGLIMRSKVFRRSLKVDDFQNLIIQGFRASRAIGFQDMWDISLMYPQGIGFPLLAGAFETFWRFQNPRVFRELTTPQAATPRLWVP